MLRELMDVAMLEDFASGLSRASGLRVCVYDSHGTLLAASAPGNDFARLTGAVLGELPPNLKMCPVPAHDPPGAVAYAEYQGLWYIVAPVYVDDQNAGYLAVGEFRAHSPAGDVWRQALQAAGGDLNELVEAWNDLPELDRSGVGHPVVTARWGARLIAEWGQRESRLLAAADQVALVGDIAELLTGQQDLQTVLDRIVTETARVMQCPYGSIRLYDPRSNTLVIKAVYNLSAEYVGKGVIVRTPGSISDEALRGRIVYVENLATDPRCQYPGEVRTEGIASLLAAGMIYRGNPIGVLRVYTRQRRRFRKAQRDLLRAVAYQAATAISHAQLVTERLRNAETRRQLELAGDLQARLVGLPAPRHAHLETAFVFEPSFEVGGDFCDFVELADGRLAAVIGDVVGKGVPASLLMSTVRGALRALATIARGPAELLHRLNAQLCRETASNEFLTLLLVAIDADARQLTYCNAGHEPLLICRDGRIHETADGNLVLGIDAREVYNEYTVALSPKDLLLMYTDGAFEARNFDDVLFGRPRLHESLARWSPLSPAQVVKNVLWDVRRFVGLAEQSDDITLVALRVTS